MLLGQARGKVGSLVFARANGQQIVRARAEVVANPQTEKQMMQRIIMNTIAQAYSQMSAITDHSFEGVKAGQKSMSYFMGKNIALLRTRVMSEIQSGSFLYEIKAFSPLKTNIFAVNDYVIAKGTLPKVTVKDNSDDATLAIDLSANTYQAVIDQLGLQRGDQLTFVGIVADDRDDAKFAFARVILDPVDANGEALPLTTAFATDNAIVSPNPRNEGSFATLAFDTNKLEFGFAGGTYLMAGAVIVSRQKADGTWLRSNATLKANESSSNDGYSMQDALDMLNSNGFETINSMYLNNAGTGTTVDSVTPVERVTISAYEEQANSFTGLGQYPVGTQVTVRFTGMVPPGGTYVYAYRESSADSWTRTEVEVSEAWTFEATANREVRSISAT